MQQKCESIIKTKLFISMLLCLICVFKCKFRSWLWIRWPALHSCLSNPFMVVVRDIH